MDLEVLDSWGGTDMICGVGNGENIVTLSLVAEGNEGRREGEGGIVKVSQGRIHPFEMAKLIR